MSDELEQRKNMNMLEVLLQSIAAEINASDSIKKAHKKELSDVLTVSLKAFTKMRNWARQLEKTVIEYESTMQNALANIPADCLIAAESKSGAKNTLVEAIKYMQIKYMQSDYEANIHKASAEHQEVCKKKPDVSSDEVIARLREELEVTRSMVVSLYDGKYPPIFHQGTPSHELEELVTADWVKRLAQNHAAMSKNFDELWKTKLGLEKQLKIQTDKNALPEATINRLSNDNVELCAASDITANTVYELEAKLLHAAERSTEKIKYLESIGTELALQLASRTGELDIAKEQVNKYRVKYATAVNKYRAKCAAAKQHANSMFYLINGQYGKFGNRGAIYEAETKCQRLKNVANDYIPILKSMMNMQHNTITSTLSESTIHLDNVQAHKKIMEGLRSNSSIMLVMVDAFALGIADVFNHRQL